MSVVQWITKEEAARLLDKSVRTVLNMAADGGIKSKTERDPARRGQKTTLFHAGDVERLKAGVAVARVAPANGAQVCKPARVKAAHLQTSTPATLAPVPSRPWLTLDEACAYSGLTKLWLLEQASEYAQAAADGMLDEYWCGHNPIGIRDMGRGTHGGRWRFHRESLERA